MDRITIIGYSNIGLSMALGIKGIALKDTEIVGTSGDRRWRDKAVKTGAFDEVVSNLGDALRGANLVILDTLPSETNDMVKAIGPVLENGCIVTYTGKSMAQVLQLADTHFGPDTTFVAGRPLLQAATDDLDGADAAVFDGTHYCLVPSLKARPEGVKTVVGLVEALGATPLFIDAHEHDSYASAVTLMPSILSSALMNAVSDSPAWRDMSKLAGDEFREMSKLTSGDPLDLAAAIESNTEPVVHWIDQMIGALTAYREIIQGPKDVVEDSLIQAWEERAKWEMGGIVEDSGPEAPSAGETVASMFVGRRLAGRVKDMNNANKSAPWRYTKKKKTEPSK
jgi:prephenate dehydrogenase